MWILWASGPGHAHSPHALHLARALEGSGGRVVFWHFGQRILGSSKMTDGNASAREAGRLGRRPRSRFWVGFLVAVAVLAAIIVITYPRVLFLFFGDREPEALTVDNRTDETLLLYYRNPDGSEYPLRALVPPIPPRSTVKTEASCTATELVARTEVGRLVARRGPFEECNVETWIIELLSG